MVDPESENDSGSEDEESEDKTQDVQCGLRCWQCGEYEEDGEVIAVPADHEGAGVIDAIITAVHKSLSTSTQPRSSHPIELREALPVIMTALLETTKYRNRYLPTASLHPLTCPNSDPRTCFTCQMHKFATAVTLANGYAFPSEEISSLALEATIKPIAGVVVDDTTSEAHVLSSILDLCRNTSQQPTGPDVLRRRDGIFERMTIHVEVRTECSQCNGVRYSSEQMDTIRGIAGKGQGADVAAATFWSIDTWAAAREGKFDCPACEKETECLRWRRFSRFPQILVVEQTNGVVSSLDWNEIRGLDLERLRAIGLQEHETALPEPRPTTPVNSRPGLDMLSPAWSGKPGSIPTSPTKGTSPTRRRRADTFDKMRQATPSPTRRKRQMENRVPTPVKRAKELMVEEIKEQEASEQDIAAICALGFDRELAIEALGETDGDVKKAVATLLAWETAENEEEIESEEEEESEDEDESEQGSTSSSFESLRERYGVSKEDEEEKEGNRRRK
ncbi:hypothetical protein PIIN_07567 [Serendipita indica DSM 11827]|uniref:UBA domain-containing protein n=1 Tax=Serendipita indica (strain DSM 11827) TaxID=1109443 RepID=G4TQM1_SERID|nr:hypothetical protein PIIN_07567 [Serendipita indica DSM 11827]